jgi:hypothetical protein
MGPDEHRNGLSSKGLLKGSKQAATILFNPPGALVLVDSQQKNRGNLEQTLYNHVHGNPVKKYWAQKQNISTDEIE